MPKKKAAPDGDDSGVDITVTTERGCGTRVENGIYAETPLSPYGSPVEFFLFDPPRVLDLEALGIKAVGVSFLEEDCSNCASTGKAEGKGVIQAIADHVTEGVDIATCADCRGPGQIHHIVDWIGEEYYPNVADFIEEVKVLGLSRRLPKSLDFSKLTRGSRIMLIHRKAMIENYDEMYDAELIASFNSPLPCPKRLVEHRKIEDQSSKGGGYPHCQDLDESECHRPDSMCARYWYQDVEKAAANDEELRDCTRQLPCGYSYNGWSPPEDVERSYTPALFMWLPINRLAVIEGDESDKAFEKASQADLPVVKVQD